MSPRFFDCMSKVCECIGKAHQSKQGGLWSAFFLRGASCRQCGRFGRSVTGRLAQDVPSGRPQSKCSLPALFCSIVKESSCSRWRNQGSELDRLPTSLFLNQKVRRVKMMIKLSRPPSSQSLCESLDQDQACEERSRNRRGAFRKRRFPQFALVSARVQYSCQNSALLCGWLRPGSSFAHSSVVLFVGLIHKQQPRESSGRPTLPPSLASLSKLSSLPSLSFAACATIPSGPRTVLYRTKSTAAATNSATKRHGCTQLPEVSGSANGATTVNLVVLPPRPPSRRDGLSAVNSSSHPSGRPSPRALVTAAQSASSSGVSRVSRGALCCPEPPLSICDKRLGADGRRRYAVSAILERLGPRGASPVSQGLRYRLSQLVQRLCVLRR